MKTNRIFGILTAAVILFAAPLQLYASDAPRLQIRLVADANAAPPSAGGDPAPAPAAKSKEAETPPPLDVFAWHIEEQLAPIDPNLAKLFRKLDSKNLEWSEMQVRQEVNNYLRSHPIDRRAKEILKRLGFFPSNIEMDFAFVSFPKKEMEAMARQAGGALPTQEQLKQAWAEGKGKLLTTTKVVTISGQQAKVEGIQETIYPTRFEPPRGNAAEGEPTRVAAKGSAPTVSHDPHNPAWLPTPAGFQTRNVGTTVNVTPQVTPGCDLINMTFIPELSNVEWTAIEESVCEGGRTTKLALQQPAVFDNRVTTSVMMLDGETLVAGGGPNKEGNAYNYLFVTARTSLVCPEPFNRGKSDGGRSERKAPAAPAKSTPASDLSGKEKTTSPHPPEKSDSEKLLRRGYMFPTGTFSAILAPEEQPRGKKAPPVSTNDIKKFFQDAGVSFPPGSSLLFNEKLNTVVMVNTSKNLGIVGAIFATLEKAQYQFAEVGCTFVAFPLKEVQDMARKAGEVSPTQELIKQAWAAGKGKLLATTRITSISGQQAKAENVTEIIYPTKYQSPQNETTEISTTSCTSKDGEKLRRENEKQGEPKPKTQAATTKTVVSTTSRESHNPGWFRTPADLQTRNVGTTLNMTSQIGETGLINLTLIPERSDVTWTTVDVSIGDKGKTTKLALQQPTFYTERVTTSIMIMDGGTVVAGGMPNKTGDELPYVLITARIIPGNAEPTKP